MTAAECREEIKAAIRWYEARGNCWLSAVGFIGFRFLFGRARIIPAIEDLPVFRKQRR